MKIILITYKTYEQSWFPNNLETLQHIAQYFDFIEQVDIIEKGQVQEEEEEDIEPTPEEEAEADEELNRQLAQAEAMGPRGWSRP